MSTFYDFNNVIKETIQVDANPEKRWTNQTVKFINKDNQFYGTFEAVSAEISNAILANCKIVGSDGNIFDINEIVNGLSTACVVLSAYQDDNIEYVTLGNSLSVIRTESTIYDSLVTEEDKNNKQMIYIFSDAVDVKNRKVRNVPTPLSSSVNEAANVQYVNDRYLDMSATVNGVYHALDELSSINPNEVDISGIINLLVNVRNSISSFG